jgi:hypothetical protein
MKKLKADKPKPFEDWKHVYHLRWWSIFLDSYDFLVEFLAALIGLSLIVFTICIQLGFMSDTHTSITREKWLDPLLSLGMGGLFAWWGLSRMWQLILDVARPALTYQGRAGLLEVRWVSGSHGGYRLWSLTSGAKSWSMAYLATRKFKRTIQTGNMVRIRYRRGTETIADIWVLDEKTNL